MMVSRLPNNTIFLDEEISTVQSPSSSVGSSILLMVLAVLSIGGALVRRTDSWVRYIGPRSTLSDNG